MKICQAELETCRLIIELGCLFFCAARSISSAATICEPKLNHILHWIGELAQSSRSFQICGIGSA